MLNIQFKKKVVGCAELGTSKSIIDLLFALLN